MTRRNLWFPIFLRFIRMPLRIVLVVPFVLLISASVGLTAFFSLKNGHKSVDEVAIHLRNESANRIHLYITNYMDKPQLVTQINANAISFGHLNIKDPQSLERHFWQQMQLFKYFKPIAFGSEQGEIYGVDRLNNGSLVIRVKNQSTGDKYYTYRTDNQGNRTNLVQVSTTFDPRTRPWYTEAVKAGKNTWTEIYPYFSSPGLAISATRSIYGQNNTLLGVTNTTVSLSQLSKFLQRLKIGRSGKTFIIERSGNLVASSTNEQLFIFNTTAEKRRYKRLTSLSSRDRVTRLTAQYLNAHFVSFNNINSSQQLDFEIDGKRQFIHLMPFRDSYGLDWVIVVVLPEADFTEHIEANTRTTVLLCLGTLVLTTITGIITSYWITQPIIRLSSASKEIAKGRLDQTVAVEGIKELRTLAQAYNQMATQLQQSFAKLLETNRQLEAEIVERKQVEEQLLHNAFHDALTDLPNRALFIERLKYALQQTKLQESYLFAVLFIDIDGFKVINDSLGHIIGNHFLLTIASRLKVCLRPTDLAARLGGDEFTILVEPIQDASDAIKVAERIQQELVLPIELDEQQVFTTASVGIALSSTVGYNRAEELLRDADTAMYRAKALGRARYEIFNLDMYASAIARLHLENDLRRAIERREFRVYYQPIVSLISGSIIGFEALLRWQHPERGLLNPADFISLAEETGLIIDIGYWTLHEACRQMQTWRLNNHPNSLEKIIVNLSIKQFSQPDLIQQIEQILQSTSLAPSILILEMTESLIMENSVQTTTTLSQIRELGVEISIDDFGTGHSSLARLSTFPISLLKIDKSFVSPMDTNSRNLEIIEIIVALAHKLGIKVTAEGIETKEQLAFIRKLNCEYAQGYFISRPLVSSDALALIMASPQW